MPVDSNTPFAEDEIRQLRVRLKAAEDVCLMFGWSPARSGAPDETDREKAAYVLWQRWYAIAGADADPKKHPDLSDKVVAEIARQRDAERAAIMTKLFEIVDDGTGGA